MPISLRKTNVFSQHTPVITIGDYELNIVHQITYLRSTITRNLLLDIEIDKRIGKASATLARLTTRLWINREMMVETNIAKKSKNSKKCSTPSI